MTDLSAALRPYRHTVLGLAGLSAVVNLLMLAGPLFMLQVQDRVLASGSSATLVVLFGITVYLYALMGGLDFLRGKVLSRIGAGVQATLETRAFEATLCHAAQPVQRARPATALADLGAIRAAIASPAAGAVFDLPWTFGFAAILFLFHPLLGWFTLASAVLVLGLSLVSERSSRATQTAAAQSAAEADLQAEQARHGVETLRALGMTSRASAHWQKTRGEALSAFVRASDLGGAFGAGLRTIRLFLQSAILALGAALVLQGQLSPGAMVAASILLGRALQPVEATTAGWPLFQRARQGWQDLSRVLQEYPETPAPMALPRPEARLEVRGLALVPPGEQTVVLQGISFVAEAGDAIAVIGPSASGKSSLARALVGLWPPAHGDVRLGGAALDQYGRDGLGAHLGYLGQEAMLLAGSVAENVARLEAVPDPASVISAARAAGAHDLILGLPQGYDTQVLAGGARLSGGQRQRIGLARAFYGDPVLLVLDEPDAGLDEPGLRALNAAISAARQAGRIVLVISHRPAILQVCNKVLMIEAARMRAFGPRDEVMAKVTAQSPTNVVPVHHRERA
jgi:ATP-binding cassette subfamily C protein